MGLDMFNLDRLLAGFLNGGNLREPPDVPFGAAERGRSECPHYLEGEVRADDARAQTKNVHRVIFDALPGGEGIVTNCRANAGHFGGSNAHAHSAPAEKHATSRRAVRDKLRHAGCDVGVVDWPRRLGRLPDLVSKAPKFGDHRVVKDDPCVV